MKFYLATLLVLSLFLTATLAVRVDKKSLQPNLPPIGAINSEIASISWGASNRSIYLIEEGYVVEHANNGSGWYIGAFPKPQGVSVAAAFIGTGLRVYVTGTSGAITEWCYDFGSLSWFTGGFIGNGIIVSATCDPNLDDVFYLYVENDKGQVQEYTWNQGWSSASNIPLAASDA